MICFSLAANACCDARSLAASKESLLLAASDGHLLQPKFCLHPKPGGASNSVSLRVAVV
jgi:hypothetical protein